MKVQSASVKVGFDPNQLEVTLLQAMGYYEGRVVQRWVAAIRVKDSDQFCFKTEPVFETPGKATTWGDAYIEVLKSLPFREYEFPRQATATVIAPEERCAVLTVSA